MQNSTPKTSQNLIQIGSKKRPQKRCKTHLFFDPGRFSRENPLGDPKMEQTSKQNDSQIGTKMGTKSAPGKKSKINAKTVKIHGKYVDLDDFHPPRKIQKNDQNGPSKRHLSGSPNLDLDRFRLDPPFLCGLGSETVPKLIENLFQNGHQNGSKKTSKKITKKRPKRHPKIEPFSKSADHAFFRNLDSFPPSNNLSDK